MSSMLGNKIRISIFGQSHGENLGVVMDGLPAGEEIDISALRAFMARRAPGQALTTARHETDEPHIVSGIVGNKTCGAPLCVLIDNQDTRSADYEKMRFVPRPSHADYPAYVKWNGQNDARGGGHFSARLTAPLCAAGGILLQMYARRFIKIGAHLFSVGEVKDAPFEPLTVSEEDFRFSGPLPARSKEQGEKMRALIESVRLAGDSLGGIVECAVLGLPVGLGEPIFDGLENRLAQAVFAIPAVKGLEFGEGFCAALLKGSENNDPYAMRDGRVALLANRAGGILGGLSSGAPIVFRAAFKPTPSIARAQRSVDLAAREDATLAVTGRHDPCVAVRAVPCVEAAAAVALADFIL